MEPISKRTKIKGKSRNQVFLRNPVSGQGHVMVNYAGLLSSRVSFVLEAHL